MTSEQSHADLGGAADQVFRMQCAIEQAKLGVCVKLTDNIFVRKYAINPF